MDPAEAWLFGLMSMAAIFLAVYYREGVAQRALLYSLLWGKILAGVFWVFRIDKPVLTIYRATPYGYVPARIITANMIIFILFIISALTILFWPEIQRELRRALR